MRSLIFLSLAALLYQVPASSLPKQLLSRVRRQLLPDKVDILPEEEGEGWSGWSQVSECSRSCGIGVQYRERQCLETRSDGESNCNGPNRVYISCNTEDCLESSHSFREEQCARYNDVEFNGEKHEWIPYFGSNVCELNCYARGEKFYRRHAASVVDGTPCDRDSLDVCVDGVCQHVGCDRVLGSDVEFDKCHICGGDDSQCKTIQGQVQTHHMKMGYHDIVLIPTGSTSINFHEVESSMANLLAVRNMNGEYLLNGNFQLHPEGQVHLAGTTFHYSHQPQSLQAEGPTDQPLYVVFIRQHGESHKIHYQYSIPLEYKSGAQEGYDWQGGDWGECTEECAGGTQSRSVSCVRHSDGEVVDDDLCNPALAFKDQDCNTHSCPASWHHGDWEKCSTTCGDGVQVRTVFCQQLASNGFYTIVDPSHCDGQAKPDNIQTCNQDVSCPEWEVGSWSLCNRVCGQGHQTRPVLCRAKHPIPNAVSDVLPDRRCEPAARPPSQQECNAGPCRGVEWVVSRWSECTGTCEEGYETRQVVCSTKTGKLQPEGMCDPGKKPESRRPCSMDEEMCVPKPKWHSSQWSVCSSPCGPGQQHRRVYCALAEAESLLLLDNSECDSAHVMPSHRECNGTDCRGRWFTGPWGKCSAECEGGVMKRDVMCFAAYLLIDKTQCVPGLEPPATEACNTEPCKEDNRLPGDQIPVGLCIEAYFGCCLDGVTPAQGPFQYGCPEFTCKETLHGCCGDGQTPAGGPNQEGCPSPFACENTAFGCCSDGATPSNGFNQEGCDLLPVNPKACAKSKYGCCSDGITAAEGPLEEGCEEGSGELAPCENSPYGCCADGVTTAGGPRGAGCNEILSDCEGSLYGCCPDGYTAAEGPNFHGCPGVVVYPGGSECARTLYGCCPDGTVAALGPDGEGCDHIAIEDCNLTLFGCCPDGIYLAEGPNFEGCPGAGEKCLNSVHGCCPDGFTPAQSSSMKGCPNVVVPTPCQSTSYGCCPDGVTPAGGYGLQGCQNISQEAHDCTQTTYGCCLDGATVSTGADFEGCNEEGTFLFTCDYSAYGCCPDEKTAAVGPNHAGCPYRVDTGAACGLPEERGPCSNYSVKWYFDPVYGDCSRFWFGGCDGNDNRFNTKDECQGKCVKPTGELDKCYLPKAPGRCAASSEKYYYNPETQQCEQFVYGGCLGNDNRFETSEDCENQCSKPHKSDVCQQPYLPGPCRGNFEKWFYDHENAMCRQFIYGGCKGNDNRFDSQQACEQRCSEPAEKVCKLPQDAGPCEAAIQNWYFDSNEGKCVEFVYGGCEGNGNRYPTPEECERTCQEFLVTKQVDVCIQPEDPGPCKAYFERWHYDQESGYCKQFVYGGCEGNGNRFETEQDCRSTCNAKPPIDVCTLPAESGPCGDSSARFHMDKVSGQCKQFIYSGCEGNGNNFETVEECEKTCHSHVRPAVEGKAHCSHEADSGPCLASMLRYYYDSVESKCKKFLYGGCEGNRNRFISEEACLRACHDDDGDTPGPTANTTPKPTDTPAGPIDVCSQTQDKGSCLGYIPAWSYDPQQDTCLQFVYGGCDGNENRFENKEDCERKCSTVKEDVSGLGICAMRSEAGPCRETETRWFYNSEDGQCRRFLYGGCEGNQNNFVTEEECQNACPLEEVCSLPSETGPCRAAKTRSYHNAATGKCEEFIYGGCAGNANRFLTLDTCRRTCEPEVETVGPTVGPTAGVVSSSTAPSTPRSGNRGGDSDVCNMQKDSGTCTDYYAVWYFEPNSRTCRRFLYGGCAGNGNRFESRDECVATCLDAKRSTPPPSTSTQSTSQASGQSPSSERPIQETDLCELPQDQGPCFALQLRWFFDKDEGRCTQFQYGGCQGNLNNFKSEKECGESCGSKPEKEKPQKESKDSCRQPKDSGPCFVDYLRFYYDEDFDECRPFVYGGCQGNTNNFQTQEECYSTCSSDTKNFKINKPGDCYEAPDPGPCRDTEPRWHFDASIGDCLAFYYGGCEGNKNNFRGYDDCLAMCSKVQETCGVLRCNLECPVGFARGPDGCLLCRCLNLCDAKECPADMECQIHDLQCVTTPCPESGPQAVCVPKQDTCGVLQCNLECPVGYSRGPDGCPECRCLNPCDAKECPADMECQIHDLQCETLPCPESGPQAVCVPTTGNGECPVFGGNDPALCVTECDEDEDCGHSAKCCSTGCGQICVQPELPVTSAKPGFCPPLQPGLGSTCEQLCLTDQDCPQSGKCCSTGCGMICMPALYLSSGCVNTVYGCCPDNKTPAQGWNYQGCTEEPPMIVESGGDLVAEVGDRVIIPCQTRGVPPPSVSWFRNREPILVSTTEDVEEGLAMLDDGSLEIRDAQPEDSTTYSCRAFNPIGSATASYKLLVQVPVSLEDTPLEVVVGVGERATLECSAMGSPMPAIRWMQNGLIIPLDEHYTKTSQGSLVIENVTVLDEGQYTCEAENGVGDPMLRTVTLQVETAFSVSIGAFNESYKVGEELGLQCQVEGASGLVLEWTKDGEKLVLDARVMTTDDGELYIGDVQSGDAGEYTCSATRDGDTATATAKVQVIGVNLPENCMDKPWYADCNLIIEANMCKHPYFSVFCCKSCHEADMLP